MPQPWNLEPTPELPPYLRKKNQERKNEPQYDSHILLIQCSLTPSSSLQQAEHLFKSGEKVMYWKNNKTKKCSSRE